MKFPVKTVDNVIVEDQRSLKGSNNVQWLKTREKIKMVRIGKMRFNIAGRPLHERRINTFFNNRSIGAKMFPRVEIGSGGGLAVKKLNILVADDDYALKGLFMGTFDTRCPGCEIFGADNGLEAIESAKKIPAGSLHILFTDTDMEKKTKGFEVVDEIRKMHPSVYIIFKSSNLGEKHEQYLNDKKVDALFQTPDDLKKLDRMIEDAVKIVEERSSMAGNASAAAPKSEKV